MMRAPRRICGAVTVAGLAGICVVYGAVRTRGRQGEATEGS